MDISGKSSRSAQSPATPAKVSRSLLLATDLQQSILAELDQSGPNRRAYSAYGVPSSQRPPGSRLGLNGQISERPTGWYHLGNGHRVYNPVLMRFHSPDRLSPFGKGGINAYAYCGGSPVGRVDPSGKWWLSVVGQAIGTFIGGLFAGAAANRVFTKVVNHQVQAMRARVADVLNFYGGVTGAVSRPLAFPAMIAQQVPNLLAGAAVAGNGLSQSLTASGSMLANYDLFLRNLAVMRETGQSPMRVFGETMMEVTGVNLIFRRPIGHPPHNMVGVSRPSQAVARISGHEVRDSRAREMITSL